MTAAPSHLSSGTETLIGPKDQLRDQIAERIWRAEYRRATGKERNIEWAEVNDDEVIKYLYLAEAIMQLPALASSPTPQIAGGVRELEAVRQKMTRLKETECRHSGQMSEALLYGLHAAVQRYLAALSPQVRAGDMALLSASEAACYRWPEETAEHRAMRAAFCDGAAHIGYRHPAQRPMDRDQIAQIFAYIWHGDVMEWRGFLSKADAFLAYPSPPAALPAGEMLKMVAALFAESVHENYTREEVVSIVEDMMRLGSPLSSTEGK